jgi:hypothetical protein
MGRLICRKRDLDCKYGFDGAELTSLFRRVFIAAGTFSE